MVYTPPLLTHLTLDCSLTLLRVPLPSPCWQYCYYYHHHYCYYYYLLVKLLRQLKRLDKNYY